MSSTEYIFLNVTNMSIKIIITVAILKNVLLMRIFRLTECITCLFPLSPITLQRGAQTSIPWIYSREGLLWEYTNPWPLSRGCSKRLRCSQQRTFSWTGTLSGGSLWPSLPWRPKRLQGLQRPIWARHSKIHIYSKRARKRTRALWGWPQQVEPFAPKTTCYSDSIAFTVWAGSQRLRTTGLQPVLWAKWKCELNVTTTLWQIWKDPAGTCLKEWQEWEEQSTRSCGRCWEN